jgi:hypothetical protein
MNIQLAQKLFQKATEAEIALLDIEVEIGKLAPDLYSNIEAKKNILQILRAVATLKDDLIRFREGKAIFNMSKAVIENLDKMNKNQQSSQGTGLWGEFRDMFNNEEGPTSDG